ncbi:MAG: hypothetical protein JJ899_13170 [Alphaproteobacteria bacterium]|nr:hypothetical protein [Alphaproteobacteria bacterium]
MPLRSLTLVALAGLLLAACSTYSSTTVSKPGEEQSRTETDPTVVRADVASDRPATNPADIILTKDDITDRSYEVIGDIKVTVNKTTIFHSDPTPEKVDERLREKAAELGADAVILVRYGSVGVSALSWGSLDGQGRAVFFPKGSS